MIPQEEKELLATILTEADQDAPRLVYADWLEEHGRQKYGEFIRTQVALSKIPRSEMVGDEPADSRILFLIKSEIELFNDIGWQLRDRLPYLRHAINESTMSKGDRCCLYHRGFVSKVTCTLEDWCGNKCGKCNGGGGSTCRRCNGTDPINCYLTKGESCRGCEGSGWNMGHGPEIVSCQPIEKVVLTDIEPLMGTMILWSNEKFPKEIWKLMLKKIRQEHGQYIIGFSSRDEALDCCSDVLISWAKSKTLEKVT